MDKEKFLKIMTYMGLVYNKEFTEEQVSVWYSFLKDYNFEELNNAIKELIKTLKRMPTIADITEQISKSKVEYLSSAEEEWQEVLVAVKKYGTWNEEGAMNYLKPYTAKITRYIGFNRICQSTPEEQVWNKKEFIAEYNALKDKITENLQIGKNSTLFLEGEENDR